MNDIMNEILREHDKIIKEKKSMSLTEFYTEYISAMQLTHSEKCLLRDFVEYILRWRNDWCK